MPCQLEAIHLTSLHQYIIMGLCGLPNARVRWATCGLTQLGFIRLSSNPAAIPSARRPAEAASMLEAMVRDPLHVYLESLPSAVGQESRGMFESLLGHKQVTDAYLLMLAQRNQATFVTFHASPQPLPASKAKIWLLGLGRT